MKKIILPIIIVIIAIVAVVWISNNSKNASNKSTATENAPTKEQASTTSNGPAMGTPGAYNCMKGSITASGSTALAPLVQDVSKKYQAKCSGANITVNLGGSGTGLANVENGSSDIGNSDIYAKTG